MKITDISNIKDFHIHLYYTQEQIAFAKKLVDNLPEHFEVSVGRFHEKNVGPHPMWSVQLLISPKHFSDVFSWVCLNREELIVFTHPNTGDDLIDHTDYAIWMGEKLDLNLGIFK